MIMNYVLATHQNTRDLRLPIDDLILRNENRKLQIEDLFYLRLPPSLFTQNHRNFACRKAKNP
jgi:hypothetical protein